MATFFKPKSDTLRQRAGQDSDKGSFVIDNEDPFKDKDELGLKKVIN